MAMSANSDWLDQFEEGTPLEATPVKWRPYPILSFRPQ
jgi:hypothetical protein